MSRCTDVTRRGLPHPDHMDGQDRLGYEQRLALELAAIGQRLVTISSEMRERSASVAVAPPPVPPVVAPPVAVPPPPPSPWSPHAGTPRPPGEYESSPRALEQQPWPQPPPPPMQWPAPQPPPPRETLF